MSAFNERGFIEKLRRLDSTVSSISALSQYIAYQKQFAAQIAALWGSELEQSGSPDHQLALIYLANDVLQGAKKAALAGRGNPLLDAFSRVLPAAMAVIGSRSLVNAPKVSRVIGILRDRNALPAELCSHLLGILDDPESFSSAGSEEAEVAFLLAPDTGSSSVVRSSSSSSTGSGSGPGDSSASAILYSHVAEEGTPPPPEELTADGGGALPSSASKRGGLGGGSVGDDSLESPLIASSRARSPLGQLEAELLPLLEVEQDPSAVALDAAAGVSSTAAMMLTPGQLEDPLLARASTAMAAVDRAELASALSRDAAEAALPLAEAAFCVEDVLALAEATSDAEVSLDEGHSASGGGGAISAAAAAVSRAELMAQSSPYDAAAAAALVARHCGSLGGEVAAREALVTLLAAELLPAQSEAMGGDHAAVEAAHALLATIRSLRKRCSTLLQQAQPPTAGEAARSAKRRRVERKDEDGSPRSPELEPDESPASEHLPLHAAGLASSSSVVAAAVSASSVSPTSVESGSDGRHRSSAAMPTAAAQSVLRSALGEAASASASSTFASVAPTLPITGTSHSSSLGGGAGVGVGLQPPPWQQQQQQQQAQVQQESLPNHQAQHHVVYATQGVGLAPSAMQPQPQSLPGYAAPGHAFPAMQQQQQQLAAALPSLPGWGVPGMAGMGGGGGMQPQQFSAAEYALQQQIQQQQLLLLENQRRIQQLQQAQQQYGLPQLMQQQQHQQPQGQLQQQYPTAGRMPPGVRGGLQQFNTGAGAGFPRGGGVGRGQTQVGRGYAGGARGRGGATGGGVGRGVASVLPAWMTQ